MPANNINNKSVAFLVCYHGRLPWYFDYFIHSCSYNHTVDFIIITDDEGWSKPLPENVKIFYRSLSDISELASAKLMLEVNITYGYKLCDFKPAYGLIFSELFKGYDFWGHCDIDIILGDIRTFVTNDILENYDLISVRPDWIPGCFLLYKNILKMNLLFTNSKDYKRVFLSRKHYCFDETNFAHNEFKAGKSYLDIHTEIESMMHVVKKMEAAKKIKPFFDFFMIEGLPGKLRWENGKMFYRNKYEILLFHLMYLKDIFKPKHPNKNLPTRFSITPTRIIHDPQQK